MILMCSSADSTITIIMKFCKTSALFLMFIMFVPIDNTCGVNWDPDELLTLEELVAKHGFRLLEYHVLTKDGYILTVHRAVPLDFDPTTYNIFRKPVIIFHGILGDSTFFYHNSPFARANDSCGDNFGFCMLNSGRYDLWLPNARGTRFSRQHVHYFDTESRFWEFSWDNIAENDIPAFIALVQSETGHRTVGYVGYSQGAATMFALLTIRPELSRVIRPFVAWAPAVYIKDAPSILAPILDIFSQTLNRLPGDMNLISAPINNHLLQFGLCRGEKGNALCSAILQAVFGPSTSLNSSRIPTYMHFYPSSCSNWQMAHFGESRKTGRFARFNYGTAERNLRAYGQPEPPEFPLRNLPKNLPIIVIHGSADYFVTPKNVRRLLGELRSYGVHVMDHRVPKEPWNHLDFLHGMDSGRLVYEKTLMYLDLFAWT